jgi:hypothetical protein
LGLDRSQWVNGSEAVNTLYQERYATRKVERLLRTNTTRPGKCDRTANTMEGGSGVRVAIEGSGNLCAEQKRGRELQNSK